ncbi:MAG TPA: IS4 family transposase [Saprospiraceae bacterium]|nr:IS4 family transposase [Saprospiraceae bacterium]HMP23491.1 IS4 family transposase [Saprospiraceae bacterium]
MTYLFILKSLFFKILQNRKSDFANRKWYKLLRQFIKVFGVQRIGCLVADREFVGQKWFEFLITKRIPFVMRLKENFYAERNGKSQPLKTIFRHLNPHQQRQCRKPHLLKGNKVFITAVRLPKDWLFFVASPVYCSRAMEYYKERWQIETLFKALKTQGFHLEDTHLVDRKKLAKLLALLAIAFVWCYKAGIWLDEKQPIRILKKTGNRLYSFFKYGFDYIQHLLLNSLKKQELKYVFAFLLLY